MMKVMTFGAQYVNNTKIFVNQTPKAVEFIIETITWMTRYIVSILKLML